MLDFVRRKIYLILIMVFAGCSSDMDMASADFAELITTFDFETSDQIWEGGISDFPVDYKDSIQYVVTDQQISNSASLYEGNGLSISADNPHGDLFYYFKKKIIGFKSNTNYKLNFEFLVYSHLSGEEGVAADEDIYLKVGAVNFDPTLEKQTRHLTEFYTLNVDKGASNAGSGSDLVNLGSIKEFMGNQPESISGNTYDIPIEVKSDSDGAIWLMIGVDSGVKCNLTFSLAAITVYYSEILG